MALINDKIQKLLQLRIKNEEFNSKTYTAMSNFLSLKGYQNAAKLWAKYAEDEKTHKQWAVDFLLDMNILPIESSQEQPQTEFKGLPQIIALSYQREVQTTDECKELVKIALQEGDYLTLNLGQKYILEQQEELQKSQLLIDQLEQFGDSEVSLRLLDNWIGENLLG